MKNQMISALLLAVCLGLSGCTGEQAKTDQSTAGEKASRTEMASKNSATPSQPASSEASSVASPAAPSASSQSEAREEPEAEPMDSAVASAVKDNPTLNAVPLANFEDLKKAFQENGFTLKEIKAEGMELGFLAENASGTVGVHAWRLENGQAARSCYEKETEILASEDYQSLLTRGSETAELETMMNDTNSVYGYVGVDEETSRVYVFQDVLDGNRKACEAIFQALGFLDLHEL